MIPWGGLPGEEIRRGVLPFWVPGTGFACRLGGGGGLLERKILLVGGRLRPRLRNRC